MKIVEQVSTFVILVGVAWVLFFHPFAYYWRFILWLKEAM